MRCLMRLVIGNPKVGYDKAVTCALLRLHDTFPLLRTAQASNSVPYLSGRRRGPTACPAPRPPDPAPERRFGPERPCSSRGLDVSLRASAARSASASASPAGNTRPVRPSSTRPAAAAPTASLAMTGVLLEHGLVHNQSPGLPESCGGHGGQHQDVGGGVEGGELGGGNVPQGPDGRALTCDLGLQRPGAGERQPRARSGAAARQASSSTSTPFSASRRPDEQEQRLARARAGPLARGRAVLGRHGRREVVHVHRLRGHEHVAARAAVALDVAADVRRRRWPRRRRGGTGGGWAARTAGGRACAGAPRWWPTARTGSAAPAPPRRPRAARPGRPGR